MRNILTYEFVGESLSLWDWLFPDNSMLLHPVELRGIIGYQERINRLNIEVESEVGEVQRLKFHCSIHGQRYESDGMKFYRRD